MSSASRDMFRHSFRFLVRGFHELLRKASSSLFMLLGWSLMWSMHLEEGGKQYDQRKCFLPEQVIAALLFTP
jgi:hypothetical protein